MIVGIDEVGRGPIAGPVCVCTFVYHGENSDLYKKIRQIKKQLKIKFADSKKLSKKEREVWLNIVNGWKEKNGCDFGVGMVSAKMIDKIGINKSINMAMQKSLKNLHLTKKSKILLDGGLKAPSNFPLQKTIIKGDEKEPSIALASIIAKVSRDRLMNKASKHYLAYGFETNSGYGTSKHYLAIRKFGLISLHRKTFIYP